MKKTTLILICFVVSLTLSACGSKRACANSNEPVVNPIMPVYYTGGVQHVWLTDYLPALSTDATPVIEAMPGYKVSNFARLEFDLQGNNTLSTLSVETADHTRYDIAILPDLSASMPPTPRAD